jgi:TonB family protein
MGSVSGEAVDATTHAPLTKLRVSLIAANGDTVGASTTDAGGVFVIPHRGGVLHLRFDGRGFHSVFAAPDTLKPDSVLERRYDLKLVPIPLDSIFSVSQVDTAAFVDSRHSALPRYPEALEQERVSGFVILAFVVDTVGDVEEGSVRVVRSSQEEFVRAILKVLPRIKYKPARLGDRKVRQAAQQTFKFVAP